MGLYVPKTWVILAHLAARILDSTAACSSGTTPRDGAGGKSNGPGIGSPTPRIRGRARPSQEWPGPLEPTGIPNAPFRRPTTPILLLRWRSGGRYASEVSFYGIGGAGFAGQVRPARCYTKGSGKPKSRGSLISPLGSADAVPAAGTARTLRPASHRLPAWWSGTNLQLGVSNGNAERGRRVGAYTQMAGIRLKTGAPCGLVPSPPPCFAMPVLCPALGL